MAKAPGVICRIVATCIAAGPTLALVIVYVQLVALVVWLGAVNLVNAAPMKGASITAVTTLGLGALLPIFAIFYTMAAALQFLLAGLGLSAIHLLRFRWEPRC